MTVTLAGVGGSPRATRSSRHAALRTSSRGLSWRTVWAPTRIASDAGPHGVHPIEVGLVGQQQALARGVVEVAVDRHPAAEQDVGPVSHGGPPPPRPSRARSPDAARAAYDEQRRPRQRRQQRQDAVRHGHGGARGRAEPGRGERPRGRALARTPARHVEGHARRRPARRARSAPASPSRRRRCTARAATHEDQPRGLPPPSAESPSTAGTTSGSSTPRLASTTTRTATPAMPATASAARTGVDGADAAGQATRHDQQRQRDRDGLAEHPLPHHGAQRAVGDSAVDVAQHAAGQHRVEELRAVVRRRAVRSDTSTPYPRATSRQRCALQTVVPATTTTASRAGPGPTACNPATNGPVPTCAASTPSTARAPTTRASAHHRPFIPPPVRTYGGIAGWVQPDLAGPRSPVEVRGAPATSLETRRATRCPSLRRPGAPQTRTSRPGTPGERPSAPAIVLRFRWTPRGADRAI